MSLGDIRVESLGDIIGENLDWNERLGYIGRYWEDIGGVEWKGEFSTWMTNVFKPWMALTALNGQCIWIANVSKH